MKHNTGTRIFIFGTLALLLIACNNHENDYYKEIVEWKQKNDNYYLNMKDSSAYKKHTIEVEKGGGDFYFKILQAGDSLLPSPKLSDSVTVNYKGSLISKIVFDQTYSTALPTIEEAQPNTFRLDRLIEGWRENLMQMKNGEIRRIVLPAYLGYGSAHMGVILPYSTLIFDIQLLGIKPSTNN